VSYNPNEVVEMSRGTNLRFTVFLLAVLSGFPVTLAAQESAKPLPEVTEHAAVKYQPLALQARISGQVHLQITTDGHGVIDVTVKDGHPLLAQAAVENVRTWKFVDHEPGTFDVTYNFHFPAADPVTFLQQPGVIEIVAGRQAVMKHYTLPEKWNAHVRNAQETIDTTLTLWTYEWAETELDGYTTGPQGQERAIRKPHITGAILGFDATLDDKYGQRLKFSMIGKKTGNKIKGVFLNYWGVGGTWTAERAATVAEPSSALPVKAQDTTITAADVAYHARVEYPEFANGAGIDGDVRLRVSTNLYSDFVTNVEVESGNPFLVRAALGNLRTWRFANHVARTFELTYRYNITASKVEFLKEPSMVDVAGSLPLIGYGGDNAEGEWPRSQFWQAELRGPSANTSAALFLDIYQGVEGASPDGYVIGPGSKKRELRDPHQDGDMLGFDMTVQGLNGKPLRVSLIGKKTGNKISGVFLDYSGTAGTWTAARQPRPTKATK
jgi:TonB family protein